MTKLIKALAIFALLPSGFLCTSMLLAQDSTWNQWRGPQRDGVWPGELPTSLSNLKLAWEKPLQPSYSGPVTDGKTVYTTETVDQSLECMTALDLQTGEVKWRTQWKGSINVPGYALANGSWIKSTPALAEDSIVVLGMRDEVICLDPATGKILWQVDLAERFAARRPPFGGVCSPLIDDGSVYVMGGGATVKLSLADGSTTWKTLEDEGDDDDACSSPVIAKIAGKRQLVVQTRTRLCGVDLSSGSLLWSNAVEAYRNMNILTPTVLGDRIYTSAQRGRSHFFEIKFINGQWKSNELWSQKTQAYMSSPVADNETIFVHSSNERLTALDVATGDILWTSKPMGKYQSLVRDQKTIMILNSAGELQVVEMNREQLSILDQRKLANDSWAYLGVYKGGILVRDLKALKVYSY